MHWGKQKENGLWFEKTSDARLMIGSADRLIYLALGRFRLRLMKPWRVH